MPRRNSVDEADVTVRCPRCRGAGRIRSSNNDFVKCPLCDGVGRVSPLVAHHYEQTAQESSLFDGDRSRNTPNENDDV